MAGLVEKSLLLGLGLLTLTRDKVVQVVNTLVEQGEVKPEEASGVVDKLVARGEEEREVLRKLLRQELDKLNIEAAMPVATRKDIEELNRKIDGLAAKVDELAGKRSSRKKTSSTS
jgi:polyhydroxyalkanoate synthesis regulator phasin